MSKQTKINEINIDCSLFKTKVRLKSEEQRIIIELETPEFWVKLRSEK